MRFWQFVGYRRILVRCSTRESLTFSEPSATNELTGSLSSTSVLSVAQDLKSFAIFDPPKTLQRADHMVPTSAKTPAPVPALTTKPWIQVPPSRPHQRNQCEGRILESPIHQIMTQARGTMDPIQQAMGKLQEAMHRIQQTMGKLREPMHRIQQTMDKLREAMHRTTQQAMGRALEVTQPVHQIMDKVLEVMHPVHPTTDKARQVMHRTIQQATGKVREVIHRTTQQVMGKAPEIMQPVQQATDKAREATRYLVQTTLQCPILSPRVLQTHHLLGIRSLSLDRLSLQQALSIQQLNRLLPSAVSSPGHLQIYLPRAVLRNLPREKSPTWVL